MSKKIYDQLIREIEALPESEGLSMSDLLEYPEHLRNLLTWMMRDRGVELDDICSYLKVEEAQANAMIGLLDKKNLIEEVKSEKEQYTVHMKLSHNYRVPKKIWQVFDP